MRYHLTKNKKVKLVNWVFAICLKNKINVNVFDASKKKNNNNPEKHQNKKQCSVMVKGAGSGVRFWNQLLFPSVGFIF